MADNSADHDVNHELPTPSGSSGEDVSSRVTTRPDDIASSSEAEKSEKKETLLEAVLKAVKPADDADEEADLAGTSPPSESATSPTDAKAEGEDKGPDLTKDPSQEELAAYNKRTRERIEQLLTQRNSLRAEADVTQTLRNFLVTNDIAREDFQLTLDLAAAMRRGDFKAFLEGVGPYVQLATNALGITLPPDLNSEVKAQRLTFDAAAQMSRDRYARALAEQSAARANQVMGNQQTDAQRANFARSIEQTVSAWETGIRQTDPDYGRKEETVRQLLWSVVHEQGPPQSPAHAVEIAKEAYTRANNVLRSTSPQRQPTRSVPSSINRAASGARPEPRSMMEAAELGLARARGA
jgi:hypothetical protein